MGIVQGDRSTRQPHGPWWQAASRRLASTPIRGEFAILAVSLVLIVAGLLEMVPPEPGLHWSAIVLNVFLYVGLPAGAILGGVVLHRSSLTPSERWIAASWYLGGIAFLSVLVFWAYIPELAAGQPLRGRVGAFVLFGNLGGVLGLIAGFNRARAAQNDRLMNQVRSRRDQLLFINSLLRHNVLNSVQAIDGYTEVLAPGIDATDEQYVANIRASSDRITDLIDDVRTLISTLEGHVDRRTIDLSTVVREQVDLVRSRYPAATVTTDMSEAVTIEGNSVLGAVFENLLDNAIEHNDRAEPTVSVTVREAGDVATVEIADDGPGIPERVVARYMEGPTPSEGRGESLGLYLVAVMLDLFDGDVRVADNDPRGSVVVVTLPLAED